MYELLNVGAGLTEPGPTFPAHGSYYLKLQFTLTLLYWSCLWAVKACFLSFFRRLTKGLKYCTWFWYFTAVIVALSYIGCVITYPISCSSFEVGKSNQLRSAMLIRYSSDRLFLPTRSKLQSFSLLTFRSFFAI